MNVLYSLLMKANPEDRTPPQQRAFVALKNIHSSRRIHRVSCMEAAIFAGFNNTPTKTQIL
ncbi:MAG: hypothetical protein CMM07_11410 [Rhodopirellula sp.]|nr:hypothetical protein [Rhodopirellula sp.]